MLLAFLWFHNFHRVERRVGTAMGLVTIVSINLVGDQLRDVLNPRLKR